METSVRHPHCRHQGLQPGRKKEEAKVPSLSSATYHRSLSSNKYQATEPKHAKYTLQRARIVHWIIRTDFPHPNLTHLATVLSNAIPFQLKERNRCINLMRTPAQGIVKRSRAPFRTINRREQRETRRVSARYGEILQELSCIRCVLEGREFFVLPMTAQVTNDCPGPTSRLNHPRMHRNTTPSLWASVSLHLQRECKHQSRRRGDRVVGQVKMGQGIILEQRDRQHLQNRKMGMMNHARR